LVRRCLENGRVDVPPVACITSAVVEVSHVFGVGTGKPCGDAVNQRLGNSLVSTVTEERLESAPDVLNADTDICRVVPPVHDVERQTETARRLGIPHLKKRVESITNPDELVGRDGVPIAGCELPG